MRFLLLFLFPFSLWAFEVDPWLSDLAEFEFRPAYSYRYYPSVDRAQCPSDYSSHDHLIDLNLGLSPHPQWDIQGEINFAHTDARSGIMQRVGLQGRYLWLNDVSGDPISLTTGLQLFYVPTRSLSDVSSPYHAQGNMEMGIAFGKEISREYDWIYRFYGFLGFGIANRGAPWIRPLLSFALQFQKRHRFSLFSEGYFGLGVRDFVNINRFTGYAKIAHHSIDIGICYTYLFEIWGDIALQYAYRPYAKKFPEKASTFRIAYRLPFSVF